MYFVVFVPQKSIKYFIVEDIGTGFFFENNYYKRIDGFTGLFYSFKTFTDESTEVIAEITYSFFSNNQGLIISLMQSSYVVFDNCDFLISSREAMRNMHIIFPTVKPRGLLNENSDYSEIIADSYLFYSEKTKVYGLCFCLLEGVRLPF